MYTSLDADHWPQVAQDAIRRLPMLVLIGVVLVAYAVLGLVGLVWWMRDLWF